MRRLPLAIIAALFLVAQAAPVDAQRVEVRAHTGMGVGTIMGDVMSTFDDRYGGTVTAAIGLGAGIRVSETLVVQPEWLLSMKGSGFLYDEREDGSLVPIDEQISSSTMLHYHEIPVLVKYEPPSLKTDGYTQAVYGGPALGILRSAKFSATYGGSDSVSEDVTDQFNSTDLGLVLGWGATASTRFGLVTIDLRATTGLSDVATANDLSGRTFAFLGMVGYAVAF